MGKKVANEERAWTANYPALERWLRERDARCNWQVLRGKEDGHHQYVESWSIGTMSFLLLVSSHRHGWDVFTSCGVPQVDATLKDADERLKLGELHVIREAEARRAACRASDADEVRG